MSTQCFRAAVIGVVVGLSLPVAAQNNGVPPAQARPDQEFVREAAMGGMTEVQLGELAGAKGMTEGVKAFGRRMVLDHGKANDELKSLATTKQISLEANLDAKHQAMLDKFAKLSGLAFDRAYVDDMVNDHKTAVAAFAREAQQGEDAEIKAWAMRTLPTLESHLREIQGLQKDLESGRVNPKPTR